MKKWSCKIVFGLIVTVFLSGFVFSLLPVRIMDIPKKIIHLWVIFYPISHGGESTLILLLSDLPVIWAAKNLYGFYDPVVPTMIIPYGTLLYFSLGFGLTMFIKRSENSL